MRPLIALAVSSLVLSGLTVGAVAQANPSDPVPAPSESLFRSLRLDATIVVSEHPTGADLVEITVRRGDHPLADLRKACERVGELTGDPVRGLVVTSTNPTSPNGFPKATFATNGLITPDEPRLRLEPIMRAFGFGRTPLRNLAIIYSGQIANRNTLQRWSDEPYTLRVEAQRLPRGAGFPGGTEYRTMIAATLGEAQVVLPGAKGTPSVVPRANAPEPRDFTLPIVLGIGALAAGGLVYSLLLRPRPGTPRRPAGR